MDERLRFVGRLLDAEKMAGLRAEFGISRKTGYRIYDRYKEYGVHGLTDRSRRPYRHANQLPLVIETQIASHGLSKLSVWWLRLGVGSERIKPGHPEQNGGHERRRRDYKQRL